MRVLLDTDVVFDFMLERKPFFQAARGLMLLNTNGEFDGYISSITPVNLFYHGRKIVGAAKIRQGIADLLKLVRVCPITQACLLQALGLPFADYEDAVQHTCATDSGLDAIVTRNLDDYKERHAANLFSIRFPCEAEITADLTSALSANLHR